ncbi:hypothetical protein [Streptomyces caniscabiei]|uniref:Uncharacterized protein n=1 Tax=Streptomyces caniscabiei TaxID=2746961 RepID=A0ABU4MKX0_9ACTN|nr:hypothetical protein [Streptomyces caniscabiei]MDX2941214.1 hypothetical protein [Streptomyces caniscabiei]MDX2953527.1 hypothetical protein [Streptomyces caniscabiei]MDX2987136.1 hypothetical protein [Streptomyces caniscabiei]MDX3009810.1 hypothetical protein [Streptomyces caniscabiei]MDX3037454.1 hypothetical protein [Streptomyces caniscabiei]
MSGPRLRSLGVDPATGREAFADTCPGGVLEGLADAQALKAAAVLVAVVGAVLEVGKASDAELAAFVPALYAALEECVGIMDADHARLASVNEQRITQPQRHGSENE